MGRKLGLKTAKILKDHWKGKRTKARIKVATALQNAFKNQKARKEVEVEFNTDPVMEESPQKLKKSGFGNLRPLLRDKLQKHRERGIEK